MNLEHFKPTGQINIGAAMADMKADPGTAHNIIFARAKDDGKTREKGSLVMLELVYGGVARDLKEGDTINKDGEERQNANYKEMGLLPCHIHGTREYRTILYASIMFYDGQKVVH